MSASEALVINFDIDEEDTSLPHAKKTRILVKERVHGLFKTSGIVHVLQLVLKELKIEGQIPPKSGRANG